MDEKKLPQTLEVSYGKITRKHGTHAFVAINTNPYVGFLNHIAVIGTVTNS